MSEHREEVGNGYYGDNSKSSVPKRSQEKDEFAEYMWMAEAADADKKMMQEIEEQDMIECCYRDMMLDELEESGMIPSGPSQEEKSENRDVSVDEAVTKLVQEMILKDKPQKDLNPMAAEFVPGQSSQTSSG